jgi:hypothetical protein
MTCKAVLAHIDPEVAYMRTLFSVVLAVVIALPVVPIINAQTSPDEPDPELARLMTWMTGSFSSQAQAKADSSYFDIRLEMARIWTDRTDGYWLYVEQAAADYLDKPYRQRVYHVHRIDDTTLASDVYTFEEPLRFAGAWKDSHPLAALTPDSLSAREGCAILLYADGDTAFVGSTVDKNCSSDLRGASYATSEVRITADYLYSWDRGFDSNDNQVWGAESGGYHFDKITRE